LCLIAFDDDLAFVAYYAIVFNSTILVVVVIGVVTTSNAIVVVMFDTCDIVATGGQCF
jgi:hypothetical protein